MLQGRRKIWELGDMQCPVIGTCLTLAELRKLSRKIELILPPGVTDFEIHGKFVSLTKRESCASQIVNKALERKFARTIRRYAQARTPETLEALWKAALADGDIPGPFWAVLTHPEATTDLIASVFGEVHMLSHLVGSSSRADIRRLRLLEEENETLRQALAKSRAARRDLEAELQARNARLEQDLAAARSECRTLTERLRHLESEGPESTSELRRGIDNLKRLTAAQATLLAERSREIALRTSREGELERRIAGLADERDSALAERESAERIISACFVADAGTGQAACLDGCTGDCPCQSATCPVDCPRLSGKRILYIGGRNNLVRHYREIVERLGGEFEHHDGGLEETQTELYGKLARAEAVLCPVDCVSHEACMAVKRVCKRCMKPFLPLRSSGLSTLARTLETLQQ